MTGDSFVPHGLRVQLDASICSMEFSYRLPTIDNNSQLERDCLDVDQGHVTHNRFIVRFANPARSIWRRVFPAVLTLVLASACGGGGGDPAGIAVPAAVAAPCGDPPDPSTVRPATWTNDSHHKSATADYATVFPDMTVLRLDIRIPACQWQRVQSDAITQIGRAASPVRRVLPAAPAVGCVGSQPESDGEFLRGTPVWVPVSVEFNGQSWTRVGLRLKGGSSLLRSWDMGLQKLPFRLDFDRFEDDFPAVEGQRFFGFDKLSFTNNVVDPSFMREKLTGDLLREHGVPAARTSWVRVYVDTGAGSQYFGLYSMSEIPDKPMLQAQFGNRNGNLYKPQGAGADWRPRNTLTDDQFKTTFEKESNSGGANWSDAEAAVDALQSATRVSDPAAWRAGLEQRLNVDRFLRWMSANAVLGNGDAYGFIAHNYYLYGDANDAVAGRLNWIAWDLDRAMTCQSLDITYPASGYPANRWPLFRYLLDDPVYRAAYSAHASGFLASPGFDATALAARLDAAQALIAPFVTGADGEALGTRFSALESASQFSAAHTQLRSLLDQRRVSASASLPLPP